MVDNILWYGVYGIWCMVYSTWYINIRIPCLWYPPYISPWNQNARSLCAVFRAHMLGGLVGGCSTTNIMVSNGPQKDIGNHLGIYMAWRSRVLRTEH